MKGRNLMTDEKIIELFFDRNEAAIAGCEAKYGNTLRTMGKRITEDSGAADECVNDTYMKAWDTIPPKKPENHLLAYLSKILRNLCFDRIRFITRKKRGASVTVLSDELAEAAPDKFGADAEVIRTELSELITSFVKELKEESQKIFVMRYFYMEELKAIAQSLSISEGKVKTVLRRTRENLKAFLENYGYKV